MACSSGCRSKTCASYGACLRAKHIEVADVQTHKFYQSQNDTIKQYIDARSEGMQPASVTKKEVAKARQITAATGVPYRADKD